MHNFKTAILAILLLLLVLAMHMYGMATNLYITTWYYDIIVHILGGVGIALSAYYVLKNPRYIIPATILAGLIWEAFEVINSLAGSDFGSKRYFIDTSKDLLDDIIGSVLVFGIIKFKNKK